MGRPRTRSRWRLSRERWAPLGHEGRDPQAPSARASCSRPHVRALDGVVHLPPDLAMTPEATHVSLMQTQTKTQIVGFMELQVGSLAVQVPIRTADPSNVGVNVGDPPAPAALPLASFEVEGDSYAILIRGDSSSKAVERAMGEAAKQAVVHLSRKLLN
jgi:hypothetical protein